jgi:hypothetical protein
MIETHVVIPSVSINHAPKVDCCKVAHRGSDRSRTSATNAAKRLLKTGLNLADFVKGYAVRRVKRCGNCGAADFPGPATAQFLSCRG